MERCLKGNCMEIKKYVNVFQGTGKSVIPKENTLYSKWNLLKGKAGNVSRPPAYPLGAWHVHRIAVDILRGTAVSSATAENRPKAFSMVIN